MSDAKIDVYHKWLGIPTTEQPPNSYRLLGLSLFEDDPDVISAAADRQLAHVRTYQNGPHGAESQELLNELSAARLLLLNPQRKAAFDAALQQAIEASSPRSVAEASAPATEPLSALPPVASRARDASRRIADARTRGRITLVGHVLASAIGISIGYWIVCKLRPELDYFALFSNRDRQVAEGPNQEKAKRPSAAVTETQRFPEAPKAIEIQPPSTLKARPSDPSLAVALPIEFETPTEFVTAEIGQKIFSRYPLNSLPDKLRGMRVTETSEYAGRLAFRVTRPSQVIVALSSTWGGGGGGGPWEQEVISREDFERQGWKEIGQVQFGDIAPWIVFSRDCQAGERFVIRNHKYNPPILFAP